jgi:predicted transposase YdaD
MLVEAIKQEKNNLLNRLKQEKLEGKLEGKTEKAREIARTMLLKGLDIQLITEITQLSQQEIEQLRS